MSHFVSILEACFVMRIKWVYLCITFLENAGRVVSAESCHWSAWKRSEWKRRVVLWHGVSFSTVLGHLPPFSASLLGSAFSKGSYSCVGCSFILVFFSYHDLFISFDFIPLIVWYFIKMLVFRVFTGVLICPLAGFIDLFICSYLFFLSRCIYIPRHLLFSWSFCPPTPRKFSTSPATKSSFFPASGVAQKWEHRQIFMSPDQKSLNRERPEWRLPWVGSRAYIVPRAESIVLVPTTSSWGAFLGSSCIYSPALSSCGSSVLRGAWKCPDVPSLPTTPPCPGPGPALSVGFEEDCPCIVGCLYSPLNSI